MAKRYNPIYDSNFIGYYKKQKSDKNYFIPNTKENADSYYLTILQHLPLDLKTDAKEKGLLDKPDVTSEKFASWSKKVTSFFKKQGIKWICIVEEEPSIDEGEFFYVSLPEEHSIYTFDLENPDCTAYIFITKGEYKASIKLTQFVEENSRFEDDLEEVEDDNGDNWEDNYDNNAKDDEDDDFTFDSVWNKR